MPSVKIAWINNDTPRRFVENGYKLETNIFFNEVTSFPNHNVYPFLAFILMHKYMTQVRFQNHWQSLQLFSELQLFRLAFAPQPRRHEATPHLPWSSAYHGNLRGATPNATLQSFFPLIKAFFGGMALGKPCRSQALSFPSWSQTVVTSTWSPAPPEFHRQKQRRFYTEKSPKINLNQNLHDFGFQM